MSKKGKKPKKSKFKQEAEFNRAMRRVAPVVIPLLEAFAEMDSVFTEEGALSKEHINKTAGRLFRQWKKTRTALDPEFDPKDYEKRPRRAGTNPRSPLVMDSRKSSMARRRTSGRKGNQTGKSGKGSARRSARSARSSGRASNGR